MATKGPSVPHRTPRSRGIEVGTNPSGFDPMPFDPQAGTPPAQAGGKYVEPAPGVVDGPPINEKNPFKE